MAKIYIILKFFNVSLNLDFLLIFLILNYTEGFVNWKPLYFISFDLLENIGFSAIKLVSIFNLDVSDVE